MNTLQCFKLIDAVGQLLITPAAYFVSRIGVPSDGYGSDAPELIACYLFGVGAWQATSCLLWTVVAATNGIHSNASRKIYSWALLILCFAALFGGVLGGFDSINPLGIMLFYVLLLLGPLMSIWYFILTLMEALPSGKKQLYS